MATTLEMGAWCRAGGLALAGLLAGAGCQRIKDPSLPVLKPPVLTEGFDREALGPDWRVTAPPGVYRIQQGELVVKGAHNHPLWLTRPLPRDAVVEVDAWSRDPAGDIKVEVYGDGRSFATTTEYTSSGYVFIQGGWSNRLTVLCRMEEHGHDRRERADVKVEPGRRYHWLIARHGGQVDWFIDGKLAHSLDDAAPLEGPDHQFFGFNNWETELHFDNLVVRPY